VPDDCAGFDWLIANRDSGISRNLLHFALDTDVPVFAQARAMKREKTGSVEDSRRNQGAQ
jgi:hypothetical protein